MTRILVTGSRHWTDAAAIRSALIEAWRDLGGGKGIVLVHGDCPTGADAIAERFWRAIGFPVEPHPADWDRFGRAAGSQRNEEMVRSGVHLCLAFLTPESRGAKDCLHRAVQAGIPVRQFYSATVDAGRGATSV